FQVHLTEKVGEQVWYRGNLDGKTVWIHPSDLVGYIENNTSKLGHIRSKDVKIYKDLTDLSVYENAGTKYTHQVYYIKREATVAGELYYRLSRKPNGAHETTGWVKAKDMNEYAHTVVDKNNKTFYVKGTGSAYSEAWGGKKDYVYSSLSGYKNQEFQVHLTEKVGEQVWYRGNLDGKTVWIHPSDLVGYIENNTSKLGHIRSKDVKIYKDLTDLSVYENAGTKYTHQVYFIKREATVAGELYYRLSRKPNGTHEITGWVKAKDMNEYAHTVVDKNNKTFYVKGTGSAYSEAWGGKKDYVYSSLSGYKNQEFQVHLTEKVGEQVWYRGNLDGKTVWIHPSDLSITPLKVVIKNYSKYNLTLESMVDIQMRVNPQTDKSYPLWIREDAFRKGSISNGKGIIQGDNWNLRRGPGTNFLIGGKIHSGTQVPLYSSRNGTDGYTWYHIKYTYGWVTADERDVRYYLNPANFLGDLQSSLQFLKLSQSANLDVSEVNSKILKGKGILSNKGEAFSKAANKYQVNEVYLISHALLETGNGTSELATGVKHKGRTVYNMYGIGANDGCAVSCGSEYAYNAGWFTPELAIIGGAEFVGKNYLSVGQDTLYKMRWNPDDADRYGYASHQYATDIGWASKQTNHMYKLYSMLDSYEMILDIPGYK
ncbi:mannosyl-glycoprotein endo-beta-N-acetylglucosamidase, partial [Virgibacillus halodenitrificans]|nr:mannosyl-glycoprotein endo-beta-N-acetylglucosamidase [Virgibacillus halodenitrificans]